MTYWCCEKGDMNWFVQTAKPNEVFVYYSGYIYDNLLGRAIKGEIYRLAVKGLVYLVQRKSISTKGYDYIMIKASKKPVIKLVPLTDEKLKELGKV